MERLFHVKRMFVVLAPVPVMASRFQTSLDSMNSRCLHMRFYDAKMGFYELCRSLYVIETPFYDIEMGFYEIGMSVYELRRVTGTSLWVT